MGWETIAISDLNIRIDYAQELLNDFKEEGGDTFCGETDEKRAVIEKVISLLQTGSIPTENEK